MSRINIKFILGVLVVGLVGLLLSETWYDVPPADEPSAQATGTPSNNVPSGSIDLNAYCRDAGYGDAKLVENSVNGWRCVDARGSARPIDFADVCLRQYGRGKPEYANVNDPNSWRCNLK